MTDQVAYATCAEPTKDATGNHQSHRRADRYGTKEAYEHASLKDQVIADVCAL